MYLSHGLSRAGYQVHALLADDEFMDGWSTELATTDAKVHRMQLTSLSKRPLRFVQAIYDRAQKKRLASFCQKLKPSGIFVNQQYDEDGLDFLQGAIAAACAPVMGMIHMPMTKNKNKRPLGRLRGFFLRRWYWSHRYRILFSSVGAQREFNNYYNLSLNSMVIPSGVLFEQLNKSSRRILRCLEETCFPKTAKDSSNRPPMIGVVCQFVHQKNLLLLIDAWKWAAANGCNTRLLLIGDGPQRVEIEARLADCDECLWNITGWTDNYAEYMSLLDLFVMPSLFESLPLALIEAVGLGIPAIISDFTGASELADQASWVSVLETVDLESLGSAIMDKINLSNSHISEIERQHFIKYFSSLRMAKDLIQNLEGNI